MIDVIIPAYNAHETICETLFSIVMQSIKDKLNVYIVNDCSDRDYTEEIERFSSILNIHEIKTKKNSGPGYARQLGIDSSTSPYLIFIDSDDVFYNYKSIEILYNAITSNNYNVVSSSFIEEIDSQIFYHNNDEIWMHGKIYKRSFLKDNNIRFNNTYSNEDTGFNNLIKLFIEVNKIKENTYVWRCNNNSITRKTDYNFWGIEGFAYNICWAVKEAEKRHCNSKKIAMLLYESMLEVYYRYIFYRHKRKDAKDIYKWSVELKKYYLKYVNELSIEEKERGLYKVFSKLFITLGSADVVLENNLSYNSFIDKIDK